MTKQIPLTKGKFALVDDEDFDYFNQWKWSFDGGYAIRMSPKKTYLHRLVNKTPDELETDHKNMDKLDNRKCNLRSCSGSQNQANKPYAQKNKKSSFRGVNWFKRDSNWQAQIGGKKNKKHIGYFKKEEDAAIAYNKAAIQMYGEFAYLNNISA